MKIPAFLIFLFENRVYVYGINLVKEHIYFSLNIILKKVLEIFK